MFFFWQDSAAGVDSKEGILDGKDDVPPSSETVLLQVSYTYNVTQVLGVLDFERHFYPLPDNWGREVLVSPRMSVWRPHFRFRSRTL